MGAKQTWRFTLADGFCLPQPGVPVAGQVTPNHVAFGQKGDENGDRDCCDEDGHQELPVVRDMFLSLVLQSACKREKKKRLPSLICCDCEEASLFDRKLGFSFLTLWNAPK